MNIDHLETTDHFREFVDLSYTKLVFLLKHSTRCPISTNAEAEYLEFARDTPDHSNIVFLHLDLIKHRDVSNTIAEELSVPHQSPQVILIENGSARWTASHSSITVSAMKEAL